MIGHSASCADGFLFTLITVFCIGGLRLVLELLIYGAVRSFDKALVLFFALEDSNCEVLSVRRHLHQVNKTKLNHEIDPARPLHRDRSIYLPVLICQAHSGKRRVFKLDIDPTVK